MTEKKTTAQEVQEAEARVAADHLTTRLEAIAATTTDAEKDPGLAAEGLEDLELASYVAVLQDVRSRLANVERELTTALGKRTGKTVGNLPDGRQFTVDRMADRKEWQHDEWQRDARRAVAQMVTERFTLGDPDSHFIVDVETGEEVPLARVLQEAMNQVELVHGSTAPRSRALKALGLYASDYCTSTPGGWRFSALKPTTKEDTTDA